MVQGAVASGSAGLLAVVFCIYITAMLGIALWARRRVRTAEDFIVAGRRLPLYLAWTTLLATWFGAGALLASTDEVRRNGLESAALDPLGAGLCLLIAGLFYARPLWRMKLCTMSDFFRRRFGPRAEVVSALVMVPSFFGWVAAQFVALAAILQLYFDLDPLWGIALVAAFGTAYTLLGGMWSVTMTDFVQMILIFVGLAVLGAVVMAALGAGDVTAGVARLLRETPARYLDPLPNESAQRLIGWLSVLTIGALGNIPGQDLMQRIFSARSARVASGACIIAGLVYLLIGVIPVTLGLSARLLFPAQIERAILPTLAAAFLSPPMAVVFTITVISAVLSTVTSAILAPSAVLAQNVFQRYLPGVPALRLNRLAVLFVATCSMSMAYLGESAWTLLENAYLLSLVGLFAPLTLGLFGRRGAERQAIASMLAGVGLWLLHYLLGWEHLGGPLADSLPITLPVPLAATLLSVLVFVLLPGRAAGGAAGASGAAPEPPARAASSGCEATAAPPSATSGARKPAATGA